MLIVVLWYIIREVKRSNLRKKWTDHERRSESLMLHWEMAGAPATAYGALAKLFRDSGELDRTSKGYWAIMCDVQETILTDLTDHLASSEDLDVVLREFGESLDKA